MLWLTPIYRSPKRDNGYDVTDYRAIDPAFGTLAEMEQLISEAAARGIGLMMDIVANHTSTEHEWFVKALAGDHRYQEYYVFRDQAFVDAHPITSIFGGSGWQYVPALDRYYLHNFDPSQADLDWDNPAVRAEMAEVINFWLDKGIKGFRFDVIDMVSKEWDRLAMSNGPRLHDYIRELNAASFGGKGIITVGRPGEPISPICSTTPARMAASSAWCSTSNIWGWAVTSGHPASTPSHSNRPWLATSRGCTGGAGTACF